MCERVKMSFSCRVMDKGDGGGHGGIGQGHGLFVNRDRLLSCRL